MLTPVVIDKRPLLAIAVPGINSRADVKALRDALLEVVDSCISDEGTKDVTSSRSLHILLNMICEINKDLED